MSEGINSRCRALSREDEIVRTNRRMILDEMIAQRDALLAARFRGVRTVEVDGGRLTYATDAEMAAAITDLAITTA
jgi:hypothetical protein